MSSRLWLKFHTLNLALAYYRYNQTIPKAEGI